MEAETRLVDLGGRFLHVRWWDAPGDTVLIAHGVTGTCRDHSPLARRLHAAGYRVLAPDAPGCGFSDAPADREKGFGLGAFAADYRNMLDQLIDGPVHWVGVSKGGGLGIRMAGDSPAHVRSLCLYDVGVSLPPAMTRSLGERLAAPPLLPSLAAFHAHVARFFERNHCALSAERLSEIALGWSRRADEGGFTYHYDAGTARQFLTCPEDFDLGPQWETLSCPVLVMRGEHSGVLPDAELSAMLTGQPDAETRVIPDAGHVNMLDDEGVQDAIIDFIDQHRMPEGTRQ